MYHIVSVAYCLCMIQTFGDIVSIQLQHVRVHIKCFVGQEGSTELLLRFFKALHSLAQSILLVCNKFHPTSSSRLKIQRSAIMPKVICRMVAGGRFAVFAIS